MVLRKPLVYLKLRTNQSGSVTGRNWFTFFTTLSNSTKATNMKITLFFSVAFLLVSIVLSAVSLYPKPEGKGGHCWTEHTGPLVAGEKRIYFENKCMRVLCLDSTLAQVATCRLLEGVDLEAEIDKSRPYPDCCPRP